MNQETSNKIISLLEEVQADIKVANGKLNRIDNKIDNISKEFNEGVNKIVYRW